MARAARILSRQYFAMLLQCVSARPHQFVLCNASSPANFASIIIRARKTWHAGVAGELRESLTQSYGSEFGNLWSFAMLFAGLIHMTACSCGGEFLRLMISV